MRAGIRLIVAGLALAGVALNGTAARADVRHAQVPEALRGSWAPAAEACPGSPAARLLVGAQTYQSADAACAVDWVEERGGTPGVIYSLHMRCGALGTTPPATAATTNVILWLKAADDAAVGPGFDRLASYRRCP